MPVIDRAVAGPWNARRRRQAAALAFAAAAAALAWAAAQPALRDARAANASKPAAASPPAPAPATPADAKSRHYLTTELDVRPGIQVRLEPAYPERAAREFVSGKAVLKLYIDANGAVEQVLVESARPTGYGFEDSAARAFRAARFSPGMKDGKRVRVQMRLEISFDSPPPPKR